MPDIFDELDAPATDVFDEIAPEPEKSSTLKKIGKLMPGFIGQHPLEPFVNLPRITADNLSPRAAESLITPLGANIARSVTGDADSPQKVAAGLQRGAAGILEGVANPVGAVLMTAQLPKLLARGVSGAFAAHMASGTPQLARDLGTAVGEGNLEKTIESGIGLAANTAFAGLAGAHALSPKAKPSVAELEKVVDETIPKAPPEPVKSAEPVRDVFDEVAPEPVQPPVAPKVEPVVAEPAKAPVEPVAEVTPEPVRKDHKTRVFNTKTVGNERIDLISEDRSSASTTPGQREQTYIRVTDTATGEVKTKTPYDEWHKASQDFDKLTAGAAPYRFGENDVRIGRASTSRKKRATGDDIVTRIGVDAPIEITRPENWTAINPDHTRYEIEARGKFEERTPAKKFEPVWRVYNKATKEYIAQGLTFDEAVARAKSEMVKNNFGEPEKPVISMGGKAPSDVGEIAPAQLAQLTESITRLAGEAEAKPSKAFDLGETLATAKDATSKAVTGLKAAGEFVAKKFEGKPEWNSIKEITGQRHLELSESVYNAKRFADKALKEIPDKTLQEAISNYVDTGGDMARLQLAATEGPARYRKGYERAMRLNEAERTTAENIKNYFEARLEEAQRAGILEDGIENYIHRVYEKDSAWKQGALAELSSMLSSAKPSLAKKRVFEYDMEAEAAGLRPIKSFIQRVFAYDVALNKAIADRKAIKALMDVKMPDGRPAIDIAGRGTKSIPREEAEGSATFINPKWKEMAKDTPENHRGDYQAVDSPALRRWKWVAADEAGNPTFVQGDVLVHPDAMGQVRALVERSKLRANPVGRAVLNVSSTVKQTMLDLSMFHLTQIAVHGFEHRSFKPAKDIDFTNPEVRGLVKGGMVVGETGGRMAFDEGLAGSSLTKHIPGLGPIVTAFKEYLFQSFIPRLKVSTGLHALERNRQRYPQLSEAEIYHKTATQMNNAFGGLNYEMMGRNRTTQDALRLALLAPDFLEARGRFAADAATKFGGEQRNALIFGAVGMYFLSRILNKLINGQYHFEPENAFSVLHNGKAYGLRTVQGDIAHLAADPMHFMRNRLNPAVTRPLLEAWTGRDEFGRKRSGMEQVGDWLATGIPISIKGAFQGREKTLFESLLNSTGLTVRRATADVSIRQKLAKWVENNRDKVAEPPGEFVYDPSKDKYRDIMLAARANDIEGVRKEVRELVKNGTPYRKIYEHFKSSATRPLTGSRKNEALFAQSLSADDKKTLAEAKRERLQIFQTFVKAGQ